MGGIKIKFTVIVTAISLIAGIYIGRFTKTGFSQAVVDDLVKTIVVANGSCK